MATDKLVRHKLYRTWINMKKRCYNPNSPNFRWYGGADMPTTVCDEWVHDFGAFYDWAIKTYEDGLQLDKDIIKKGNRVYCPEFCSFVTQEENLKTRSNITLYEFEGEWLNIPEIAERIGLPPSTVYQRIINGVAGKDPFRKELLGVQITRQNGRFSADDVDKKRHLFPRRHGRSAIIELDGFSLTREEWSIVSGVPVATIRARVNRGMTLREALKSEYIPRPQRKNKRAK